jgi:hypothetical protein
VGNAHLVPFSDYWNGAAVTLAMPPGSRTAVNLVRAARARLALDGTLDVVLVDGTVAAGADDAMKDYYARATGWDPRTETVEYLWASGRRGSRRGGGERAPRADADARRRVARLSRSTPEPPTIASPPSSNRTHALPLPS